MKVRKFPYWFVLSVLGLWGVALPSAWATENYRPQILFSLKTSVFGPPEDMAVDRNGNFYLLSASKALVHIYNKTGQRIGFFHWEGAPQSRLKVDESGKIIISSKETGQTWVYDQSGKLLEKMGFVPERVLKASVSFPVIDEYRFVRVLAKDDAGCLYALYQFKRDEVIYHFQVSNTENNPPFRTYKFDKNLKCLCSFDSPILFNYETQSVYGFHLASGDQVEFLKWVPVP